MHTTSELDANVPAFLAKLWKIVEDPRTNHLISWSPSGKSFIITNQPMFTKELLPHYYKHSNMASFIRQLNMYGFHKKVSAELGGLKCDKDEVEFAHQFFCKNEPYLLEHIKRKVTTSKNQESAQSIKPEVGKMIAEVKNMKGRQENMNTTLNGMKMENVAMWRELAMLRQKHIKQQQIINKLIQFLVTLVQPPSRSGLSVKRRFPLMINDSSRPHKQPKLSKSQASPRGPVIHELDASEPDVDSDYNVAEMLENKTPTVHSPQEHIEMPTDDENMEIIHLVKDPIQNSKIETKKKRVGKGKKKRKSKVPVRILIPSLENGENPRKALHMLEVSTDEDEPVTLLKNKFIDSKPIPTATVRSSKLAAMAANINKSQDVNTDMDTPTDLEDNMEVLNNVVKLEDILIVPEMFNDSNVQKNVENSEDSNSKSNKMNKRLNQMDGGRSILMTNNNEQRNENRMVKSSQKENNTYDRASTSSSKDLSVSCVNPPGLNEANYRLESMDEIGNRLENMQGDLADMREALYNNENYTIDANTILGLFSADDPMTYGFPINPELNPNSGKEDDDNMILDSANGSAGSELMTYNSNPMDFDDIFLENPSPLLSNSSDLQMNNQYTESLDIEDSKVLLLDSLVTNNMNS